MNEEKSTTWLMIMSTVCGILLGWLIASETNIVKGAFIIQSEYTIGLKSMTSTIDYVYIKIPRNEFINADKKIINLGDIIK